MIYKNAANLQVIIENKKNVLKCHGVEWKNRKFGSSILRGPTTPRERDDFFVDLKSMGFPKILIGPSFTNSPRDIFIKGFSF